MRHTSFWFHRFEYLSFGDLGFKVRFIFNGNSGTTYILRVVKICMGSLHNLGLSWGEKNPAFFWVSFSIVYILIYLVFQTDTRRWISMIESSYVWLHYVPMYWLLIWQHASFLGESRQPMINQLNRNCEISDT